MSLITTKKERKVMGKFGHFLTLLSRTTESQIKKNGKEIKRIINPYVVMFIK